MESKGDRRDPLEPLEEIPEILADRPKPKPARDRSWDAKRSKATYDLPADIIDRVRGISEELAAEYPGATVRVSDVARLLLEAGLERYEAGELDVTLHPAGFRLFLK